MTVRIETLEPARVAFDHHAGPFAEIPAVLADFLEWANLTGADVVDGRLFVMIHDEPGEDGEPRWDVAMTVGPDTEAAGDVGVDEIEGGLFAVRSWTGSWAALGEALDDVLSGAEEHGWVLRDGSALAWVLRGADETVTGEETLELWVPVAETPGDES
jgi:DNA gyrase inhibitor GyrI